MNPSRTDLKQCQACGAQAVYQRKTDANGGYGPRLLRGLGRFFSPAKVEVYLCAECGYMRLFADAETRARVKETLGWRRLK